jgi:hypothetical protein
MPPEPDPLFGWRQMESFPHLPADSVLPSSLGSRHSLRNGPLPIRTKASGPTITSDLQTYHRPLSQNGR